MERIMVLMFLFSTYIFAIEPATSELKPLPVYIGDEHIPSRVIPYLGGRQSPGDSIGMTVYDMQVNNNSRNRIMVDDNDQAHIDWMRVPDTSWSIRLCAWNARFTDGSYFGETPASVSWSGFVKIAVTRDIDPDNQRSVIAYHYDAGSGYYAWIDIDQGNLWGTWPNDPKSPQIANYIWPDITVANNGNIVMATGDYPNGNTHHLLITTDEGNNWTLISDFDSCAVLTHSLQASRNTGSDKVVFAHTQFIADTIGSGQIDEDIWYMVSTDGGITWGPHINLTNYQPYPIDSVRAYADANPAFDISDNLHIVWAGRRVTDNYWEASKIFHWDEVNDTITIVSSPSIFYSDSGGWWISTTSSADPGSWRMPADWPQIVFDPNGTIYCLWHGNDDYNDGSAGGYFNGELYGSYSTDDGITWADYVNLTNTRSPGAGPGECMDEDYMTAYPYVVNDSVFVTYIEDKDAGAYVNTEGVCTDNPVRCWVFHKNLITEIEEGKSKAIKSNNQGATIISGPLLLPEDKNWRIFDIMGRQIYALNPVPGIYFIEVDGEIQQKVIKIK